MSLAVDASAAVALHFADEREPFANMEDRLANGEEAFTAPNFFQEVMEALRRAIRERRTTSADVQAWLERARQLQRHAPQRESGGWQRHVTDR